MDTSCFTKVLIFYKAYIKKFNKSMKMYDICLTYFLNIKDRYERFQKANSQRLDTRKKKRVLMLLSNAFDPDPRVYQEAKAEIQNGYDVTIICWDRDCKMPLYEIIDGIKVERIYIHSTHGRGSSQVIFIFLFWIKVFFKIIFRDFDLVHCHDFDTLPLGFLIGKIRRKKIIYDSHENYVDMLADNVHSLIKKTITLIENNIIRRVDLLITVGEILREDFVRRGAKKAVVVGNWKCLKDFSIPKRVIEAKRKELNISKEKLVVSFICHLNKERKISEILEAVKLNSNIHLIIGGGGALEKMVEKEARYSQNITYLGFVNPKDIPLYTCISDVIFYGFDSNNNNAKYSAPNKLFEALAAGKAIITGNFGEIGCIVKKYKCGVILKDYSIKELDRALTFLKNRKILTYYQNNNLKLAQSIYNWEQGKKVLLNEINKNLS